MSPFDAAAAYYLSNVILPVVFVIVTTVLITKNIKPIRQRIFARCYPAFADKYNEDLDTTKAELFKDLHDFKSLDWDLRNKGLIRILEIGVGPGCNFKFYPKNSKVIAVDPNPYFRQYLEEKKLKFPNVKLEQVLLSEGENLVGIEDDSVDIVITTMVLCSVRDVRAVLREIRRVLASEGKYFFLEHIIGEKGSTYRRNQSVVEPIWAFLYDCHLTRDLDKMIKQSGFSNVCITKFIAPLKGVISHVMGPHIMGSVQK